MKQKAMAAMKSNWAAAIGSALVFGLIPFLTVPLMDGKTGWDYAHGHATQGYHENSGRIDRSDAMLLAQNGESKLSRECMSLEYKIDRLEMKRLDIMSHPRLSEQDKDVELQEVSDDIDKLEKKLEAATGKRDRLAITFDDLAASKPLTE